MKSWRINTTNYNRYKAERAAYQQTNEWKAKNNFHIYVIVLTIALLTIFG